MAKVIPNRRLAHQTFTAPLNGKGGTFLQLPDVISYLTKLEGYQQPKDITVRANNMYVEFRDKGWMSAQSTIPGQDTQYLFTERGAKLLANLILPGHFFKGLRQLAFMDSAGADLATRTWQKFSPHRKQEVLIRTILTRNPEKPGEVVKAIRSCHSTQYAAYSNLQLVKDLDQAITSGISMPDVLDEGAQTIASALPVMDWVLTDERMRIRFCGVDPAHAAFAAVLGQGSPFMDGEPMPVFEVHNSEVGMRRVVIRAGVFLADKGVFIGAYGLASESSWTHRGNVGRIRKQLNTTISDILEEANDVCEAYKNAEVVELEDAYEFVKKHVEASVTKSQAKEITETLAAQVAVKNLSPTQQSANTAQPGSALQAALASLKTATLAEVCDAVATVAKKSTDLSTQYDLEKLAATILHRGLAQAAKKGV